MDAGCGTGRPALQLARTTGAAVTGITLSGGQVRLATVAAAAEGLSDRVSFRLADAAEPPFPAGSFDGAWLFESLLHMPDPGHVLRRIHDVSEYSVPQTLRALCAALRADGTDVLPEERGEREEREERSALLDAMDRLAATPELGYAIVVAARPRRP